MNKTLLVYYSLTDNTKKLADIIKDELKIDDLEIHPQKSLKKDKFSRFIIGGMQAIFAMKPALLPLDKDLNQYDTIILGFPIWGSNIASPINTFIKEAGFKNKKIHVFTTSESEVKGIVEKLNKRMDATNKIIDFQSFINVKKEFARNKKQLEKWLKTMKDE